MLQGLDTGTITLGQARRILGYQAIRQDNDPTHQFLYRQAAAALRQMQREEYRDKQAGPTPGLAALRFGTPGSW
jgi:hypothetical protein